MRKLSLMLAFLFTMGMQVVFAQTTISGTVTDDKGEPIPGANIRAKGYSDIGTISDLNGQYNLNVPAEATTLVYSFVGMATQEIEIAGRTVIDVAFASDDVGLEEVVVTALGIERDKKKLGYSVSTVDNEELNRGATTNFTNALSGKVAGVQVSGGVGAPGESTNVLLRGYANIGRATQPLYVIDGVPVSNAAQNFSSNGTGVNRTVDFGNGINDISSLDIESMSILRGAAATALYGSQAANGVIMITTKSGKKKDKPSITFNSTSAFSSVLKFPTFQDKFGQGWDGNFASEENGSWGPVFSNEDQLWGNEVDGKQLYKKNSFLKDQLRDFYDIGTLYDNSVAITGGGESATYYASYNYVTSDGVVPKDKDTFKKHSFKLKSTMNVGRVSATGSVNYINKETSSLITGQGQGGNSNLFDDLLQHPTDISLVDMQDYKDPKSFYNTNNYFSPYLRNPYFTIDNSENVAEVDRFIGNLTFGIDLVEAYRLKGTFRMGGDVSNTFGYNYDGKYTLDDNSVNKGTLDDIRGYYREFQNNVQQYNIDMMLSGGADLMGGDLIIDANVGYNIYHRSRNYSMESVDGLVFEQAFPNLANSTATPNVTAGFKDIKRLLGLYGSADFGFKSYLFLSLTARNDWSSALPKDNNTYFYPSASLGFIFTDAIPAMGNIAFLDYMKARVSWGLSGADAPPYVVTPTYIQGAVLGGIPFSDITFPIGGATGYEYNNTLGNPNLTPEITHEFEVGMDLRFFKNRLGIDATYYNRRTDGMILLRTVASTSGFTAQYDNIGEILNEGVELTVNVAPIRTTDFRWDVTYTFSKNNNKVLSLTDGLDEIFIAGFASPQVVAIAGKSVSHIKGTGMQYTQDGRIVVDPNTGRPLDSETDIDLGSTLHDYVMGMTNRISYKGLEFSIQFDFRKGGKFISNTKSSARWTGKDPITTYNDRKPFVVPNSVYLDDATGEFVENTNPITKVDLNNYYAGGWNDQSFVLDKTFLKLREVNLTYNIPASFLARTFIERASISIVGNNLFLWTPVENNVVDPEISTSGLGSASEFGEINGYPSVRTIGFRLNVNL